MRPLFPFYGSKWRDARRYPSPRTGTVVEPFAGSAGYSVFYAPAAVTLVEIDPIVAGVWRYLIRTPAREIRALPDLEPGASVDDLALCQEARWLIGFWLNRGSSQPKKTQTAYSMRTERAQLVWSARARERIALDVEGVRAWRVVEGDYRSAPVLAAATYFVDPPYVDKGRYYRFRDVDYDELGRWCRALPDAIVCEQAGATWLPFEPLASIKSTRGRSEEVVFSTRPDEGLRLF